MDCVCGCEKEIPGKLSDRNFLAASVALELLVWDKDRTFPKPGPDGREGLIARGADCYQRLLYSLHGEGGGDPDDDCSAWLRESAELRATRSDLNVRRLFGNRPPNLSKSDLEQLDRRHPETSFTGAAARAGVAVAPPGDGDLVDQLERLGALRDDGVLTDDEFAAAKARLLGG